MIAVNYRLQTLSALARQKIVFDKSTPTPRVIKMKSWKKERYRRQKLFIKIKQRRQFYRDLTTWSDLMLRNIQTNNKLIAKITKIQRGRK